MSAHRKPRLNLLCAGLLIAIATPAMAQEAAKNTDIETKQLDKVTVTGSRIARATTEGPAPVVVMEATRAGKVVLPIKVAGETATEMPARLLPRTNLTRS